MDNGSIKDNITRIRTRLNISQSEMADRMGISRNAYRNIESGDTKLISEYIVQIAALLDLSTEEIVLGYIPQKDNGKLIEDIKNSYNQRSTSSEEKHKDELTRLKREIETLKDLVKAQKETIATKNEMISMLRKIVSDDQIQ